MKSFSSFSSKIILAFTSLIIFALFIFGIFTTINKQKVALKVMEENLLSLVDEKKSILELRMKQVESEVKELAYWLNKYKQVDEIDEVNYIRCEDGTLREYGEDGNISLFVNNTIELTDEVKKQIFYTKRLEEMFIRTISKNSDIVCVYAISKDGVLRVYPHMKETQLDPKHDFREDHYFKYALEESKGENKIVWTKPYYDWADRGLVVTCAYPIYDNGNLEYIIFADVMLNSLQQEIADFKISKFGYGFLIDNSGGIIYHPNYLDNPPSKGDEVKNNILSLSDNKGFNDILKEMIAGKTGQRYYYDNKMNIQKLITYAPVGQMGWSLGFEINSNEYTIDIEKYLGSYALGPIAIVSIFSIFIFYALKRTSNYLVDLSARAEELASGKLSFVNDIKGGNELETIANSLNIMSSNLKDYMDNLIRTNIKLEVVFNSMKNIIFVVDSNYKIVNINSLGKEIIGNENKLVEGISCYEYFKKCSSICDECPVKKTINSGEENFQEVIVNNNVYHIRTYPIFDKEGKVVEVVVYSTKETERVMIEREFYQREKLASVGQVAAAITHELRNPLGIINGSSYLIKDIVENSNMNEEDKNEIYGILKEIDTSVSNSQKIISTLLDFSRKSNDKDERVNIVSLLEQILFLHKKYILENKVKVVESYEEKDIWVNGNLDSLRLIFINLIDNALYEMKDGGTLTVEVRKVYNDLVKISIKDTGRGMDEKELSNIFKPFYTTKPKNIGTGIGMWLVDREVKRNKGKINVKSALGQGTIVEVLFHSYGNMEGGENV